MRTTLGYESAIAIGDNGFYFQGSNTGLPTLRYLSLTDAQNLIGKTASLKFMVYDDSQQLVPATGVIDGKTIAMTGSDPKNNTYPARQGTTFAVVFETTGQGAKLMQQISSVSPLIGSGNRL